MKSLNRTFMILWIFRMKNKKNQIKRKLVPFQQIYVMILYIIVYINAFRKIKYEDYFGRTCEEGAFALRPTQ